MNVPPYFPEPIEVNDNLADSHHTVRLGFVRRVCLFHLFSLCCIVGVSRFPWPVLPSVVIIGLFMFVLLGLSLVRIAVRLRPSEQRLSLLLSPALVVAGALVVRECTAIGWATWIPLVVSISAWLYSLISGRDFSFMGLFLISTFICLVVIAWVRQQSGWSMAATLNTIGFSIVFVFYFVYDLSMLLRRRRPGEEPAAVIDLYRDVLNLSTYSIRVYRHWKRHPFWEQPKRPSH